MLADCRYSADKRTVSPRRLVALTLSLSLLVLSAVRADAACARHGEHATSATSAHDASAEGEHHSGHAPAATKNDACNTPVVPDCCQALAACSMTLGGTEAPCVNDAHIAHNSVGVTPDRAPMSRVTPPEPPPPRL